MNWDRIKGQWLQVTGRMESSLGKVSHDDMQSAAGTRREIFGKLQARYGAFKDDVEMKIDQWITKGGEARARKRAARGSSAVDGAEAPRQESKEGIS